MGSYCEIGRANVPAGVLRSRPCRSAMDDVSEPALPNPLEALGLSVSHTGAVERKLASVLFVDLVGSTALVAGSDPEVVRRRVTQFFELVSGIIEAYGGTVERFAGDAVMAAFGVPRAHEDDAERALRAAMEIREGVAELGLECRIGVEAGEIVSDDTDTPFATGQAVHAAEIG